jgi:hypothetical protein
MGQILKGTTIMEFYRNTTNYKQDIHQAEHTGRKDLRAKTCEFCQNKNYKSDFYKIINVQAYKNMNL